jgi:type I restriction enzyme S subunit
VSPLIEHVLLTMGQSPPSTFYNTEGSGLPFHQGVTNYGERFPTHVQFSTAGNRYAEQGDVLFSVRAPLGRINISDRKIIVGRGLSAIRHKKNLQAFLVYFLKNTFETEDSIGSGTIFNAVNKKEMENIRFLEPNNTHALQFDDIAQGFDRKIALNACESEELTKLRDTLLPKLISGKLRIPDAEKLAEAALA